MDIRIVDHFVFADYGNTQVNNSIVNQIASHTTETWQPDRANAERGRNTRQEKIAEEILSRLSPTNRTQGEIQRNRAFIFRCTTL